MWQRFTERARRIVFFAQEEAAQLGENYVSTEHLLLGIIREQDNFAVRILTRLGIRMADVREAVLSHLTVGASISGQDMQLTPRAKKVIDITYLEAKALDCNYIGTEHLLLGLLVEEEGLAGRVLRDMGVQLEAVRAVVNELSAAHDEGRPKDQSPLPDIKQTLERLKETFAGRAEEAHNTPAASGEQAGGKPAVKRGDIGVLRATPERPQIEFVVAEADLAEFADVMNIRDEYAYRDMVGAGKIVLLDAGTSAKYLRAGEHGCWYVRLLDGARAGETGYVRRDTLQDARPDDRPFPPPV